MPTDIHIPRPTSLLSTVDEHSRDKRTIREQAVLRRRSSTALAQLPHISDGEHASMLCLPERKSRPAVDLLGSIVAMARRHGPVDMTVATFSVAKASVDILIAEPYIRSRRWILDAGAIGRGNAGAYNRMIEVGDVVRLVRSHAKIAVLTCDGFGMTISGSANLGRTRHYEQLDFVRGVAYAHRWIEMLDSIEEWSR